MRRLLALMVLLGIAGFLVWRSLQPVTYGFDRSTFVPGPRDTLDPGKVIASLPGTTGTRPPNVIIILADDLGWGDVSVQGSAIRTPNIDQLAAAGVRLTDFYASAAVCTPSRAGLLTGRYPMRSGFSNTLSAADDTFIRKASRAVGVAVSRLSMVDLAGDQSAVQGLPVSEITIAEALKERGYATLAVGKWHLGDFTALPQFHPAQHGFDHFFGYNLANDDFPVALWRDQTEIMKDIGTQQETHTREFTGEAVKYIKAWRDRPFFIYLAHKDPHLPFFPSGPFVGKSGAGRYGDAVTEFDWSVGEVMRTLREQGIADDTLVIVTSDNGPWYEGSSGGLRGRKGQTYEGGFRVPFVAAWPGRIPPGTVSGVPAMNIDLLPTILSVAGLSPPGDRIIDGADISPLLSGGPAGALAERALYFAHDYDVEAVRRGRYKLIARNSHYTWPIPLDKPGSMGGDFTTARDYHPADGGPSVPTLGTWPLLYDLENDPAEAYNVLQDHPDMARRLEAELERWQGELRAAPRGWKD